MKRLSALFVLLVLVRLLCLPVLAAKNTVESSASELHRGEEVTVTFRTTAQVENRTAGVYGFIFDCEFFEYIDGSCAASSKLSGTDSQGGLVTGFFQIVQALAGAGEITLEADVLYTLKLKVREDTPFGQTPITGEDCSFTTTEKTFYVNPGSQTVEIVCAHSYGDWTALDDTTDHRACAICQDEQTAIRGQAPDPGRGQACHRFGPLKHITLHLHGLRQAAFRQQRPGRIGCGGDHDPPGCSKHLRAV